MNEYINIYHGFAEQRWKSCLYEYQDDISGNNIFSRWTHAQFHRLRFHETATRFSQSEFLALIILTSFNYIYVIKWWL